MNAGTVRNDLSTAEYSALPERVTPAVAPGQELLDLGTVQPSRYTEPLGDWWRMEMMRRDVRRQLEIIGERRQREELRDRLTRELMPRIRFWVKTCRECGRTFPAERSDARYCPTPPDRTRSRKPKPDSPPKPSSGCRQLAYRRRVQRRLAPAPDTQSGPLRE